MVGKDMIGQTRWPKELYGTPPRVGLIKNLDKFDAEYFSFEETEVSINLSCLNQFSKAHA